MISISIWNSTQKASFHYTNEKYPKIMWHFVSVFVMKLLVITELTLNDRADG